MKSNNTRMTRSTQHNFYMYFVTFIGAIGGLLFGYDTGVISGALLQLAKEFNMSDNQKEAIVSVTVAGAIVGATCAGASSNQFGRKPVVMVSSIVFIGGAVIMAVARSFVILLLGRLIVGIAIGVASMVVPIYLAEMAPASERGRLVTVNTLFCTGGQFFAACVDGFFAETQEGWRWMLGLGGVPAVFQLFGFLALPESPRYLVGKGHVSAAKSALCKLRGVSVVIENRPQSPFSHDSDPNCPHQIHMSGEHIRLTSIEATNDSIERELAEIQASLATESQLEQSLQSQHVDETYDELLPLRNTDVDETFHPYTDLSSHTTPLPQNGKTNSNKVSSAVPQDNYKSEYQSDSNSTVSAAKPDLKLTHASDDTRPTVNVNTERSTRVSTYKNRRYSVPSGTVCHNVLHSLSIQYHKIAYLFKQPTIRRAVIVGCALQLLQQFCGINTVMYYSGTILQNAGFDQTTAIWLVAAVTFTNFAFTVVGMYAVEKAGRRKLTLISLLGVGMSLILLGIVFFVRRELSPPINETWQHSLHNVGTCNTHSTCVDCVMDTSCGFWGNSSMGVCIPGNDNGTSYPIQHYSQNSHVLHTTIPSFPWVSTSESTWFYGHCPGKLQQNIGWGALAGLILYLMWYAPGLGCMPWTINSEIYPFNVRATAVGLATTMNWTANLIVSITFLSLAKAITSFGAFTLYGVISFAGVAFLYFKLPETKGKTLEEIQILFSKPHERSLQVSA